MTPNNNAQSLKQTMPLMNLPSCDYDIVGSIVIFNTKQSEIDHAIRQFLEMTDSINIKTHLCIIDNSPAPLAFHYRNDARISYFFARQNLGYGRAHNIALRASCNRSRYNLIMNTDVTYAPTVVARLKEVLDRNPTAGLAAPKILYPDGTLQHVCRLLPTPTNVFLRGFLPRSNWTLRSDTRYELRRWQHDSIANIPFFQGSFLLARTDICTAIDGFDERFFLYAEDIDFCRRLHRISQTLYVPDACITHHYRRYSKHSFRGKWLSIQSHCQYFNKWGWFIDHERDDINERTLASLK